MKRLAAAGTFALLAGGATLILVASILYSCRQGGDPHNPRSDASSPSTTPPPAQVEIQSDRTAISSAARLNVPGTLPDRL
jgi:hypothetical protein